VPKPTKPAARANRFPIPEEAAPPAEVVEIRGARQNNLKGIDLDLPLGRLNVITGPSGSGKSSLAFDTIYAEGQRRYVETFSPYTRQFLERMDKPKVDAIRGIPPAIAIEQSNQVKSTRSTVGTITEINDYLKLFMPRVARAFCPSCGGAIKPETPRGIAEQMLAQRAGETLLLTFAVPAPPGAKPGEFFKFLQAQGYLRVWIDGQLHRTDEEPGVALTRLPLRVLVVQDRLAISAGTRARMTESIETALRFGKGRIRFIDPAGKTPDENFSTGWHCARCDLDIKPPTPGLFSFNNPLGACPQCRGFGRTIGIDLDRALPNKRLSIAQGVVKPFQSGQSADCQRDLLRAAAREEIDVRKPFEDLPEADQRFVIHGEKGSHGTPEEQWENGGWYGVKGYFDWLETKTYKMHVRVLLSRYRAYTLCPECNGGRFQPATLNYRLIDERGQGAGAAGYTLPQIAQLPVDELAELMAAIALPANDSSAEMLQREIINRLRYLCAVGLGYLNLDRPTRTLSGGEIERVNLTTCLGASLVNTLFVLDEPSVGLHPRDVGRLIRVMEDLRDKGNTLLVVEHEEAVIRAADHLIDIGPGRGEAGGELVFDGPLSKLAACKKSLTSDYLTGRKRIAVPAKRRAPRDWLRVRGASEHNLQNIDADLPLGVFACITGVSGSGKSTFVHDVLYQNLLLAKGQSTGETAGRCREVTGANKFGAVVMVDQAPLAKTPRSSPVVYLGVFDSIRELFAMSDEARAAGLSAGSFSFNSGDGRCERCGGIGFEKIEMQFLSDLYVRCAECEGQRFQPHVLKVHFGGKNIHEVLEMTVAEAVGFIEKAANLPGSGLRLGRNVSTGETFAILSHSMRASIDALRTLCEVGLGYLRLGQPLNTLSGGEAQRLKLVGHLVERAHNPDGKGALLIFDEPTTGLHFDDVALLVEVFQRLVDHGDSLLVIEHNLEVIKCADYLLDLGPEAGANGGLVVAFGTPEEVAAVEASHTGHYLRPILQGARDEKMIAFDGVAVEEAASLVNGQGVGSERLRRTELPSREAPSPKAAVRPSTIRVRGAREHNLKNISLDLPRERMVIVTGLSGSGKSTLAFDILFAEGQRRFLDSMSPYARQFVEQLEKPDVDLIEGLPPSVAIEQRITRGGGKSTVATVTEAYHFLRLLFAKLGVQHCPDCGAPVQKQSQAAIVKQVEEAAQSGVARVLAPLIKARKGFHTEVAAWALKHGFETLFVDGKFMPSKGFAKLERFREHTIDVVVGEIGARLKKGQAPPDPREIVRRALEIGKGTAKLLDARNRATVLSTEMSCPECKRAFEELDPRLFSYNSPHGWCEECRGFGVVWKRGAINVKDDSLSAAERELAEERQTQWLDEDDERPCPACAGARLNMVARAVRLQDLTIDTFARLPVGDAVAALDRFKFKGSQAIIAEDVLAEIRQRLSFMQEVGLGYLALDRSAKTLSGGETQRIRLAAQLGSNLRGVLYVLDEPTIGLHPRDNARLLDTLVALKGKGNSLIIVEHDDETMRRADYIIDLGPGPGVHGGEVVAQGTLEEIRANPQSITGRCLKDPLRHPMNGQRRPTDALDQRWLELAGASANNLRDVDARFPVGRLTVITGISGSGKSTLMRSVLLPAAQQALAKVAKNKKPVAKKKKGYAPPWQAFRGVELLGGVYEVDQSPIGKTSRSTPATYVGVLDEIRALFAQLPLARIRGYSASRFSFNTEGGRCESCLGQGVIKHEMSFLPTSYVPCEDCGGLRYNAQTLEVLYNEKSIGEVLNLTIEQAAEFFGAVTKIHRPLSLLTQTGLGYLRLGQSSPTLSGGEAQRLKLVTELARGAGAAQTARLRQRRDPKSTLYLLEEPTVGLHMADVEQLLKVLHRLADEGNTVVVIEHHLSVIAEADYLIDIGPEAGDAGGELVASGTPEEVAAHGTSRIAPFLRETLGVKPEARPTPGARPGKTKTTTKKVKALAKS
jgi:excinuclease ABC subunit A